MMNYKNIVPNWKIRIEEVSNNVYFVTGRANYGSEISYKDSNLDFAIQQCENYAFDIEKQVNKEWCNFLYDYLKIKLAKYSIVTQRYDSFSFGSWFIELVDYRVIFDGKDSRMIIEVKNGTNWIELQSNDIKAFSFADVIAYCNIIENKTKSMNVQIDEITKGTFLMKLMNKLKRKN